MAGFLSIQLWEVQGDNDPVDVVEIGGTPLETAGVYSVKALGAYAMIDGGELDWKIICIRADHPLAPKLNDISDVERWHLFCSFFNTNASLRSSRIVDVHYGSSCRT